ncbi:hypothetical protein [Spongorhabdus nitratireducens]
MKIEHYQQFTEFEARGLKKQATAAIRAFIDSFDDSEEIEAWVWKYLPGLKRNRNSRIRHEIFHELVYPVLKAGYERDDFDCTLWLGKLSQNLYQSRRLHEESGWISAQELYEKCHEIDPENSEVRLLLLGSIISWLEYTEHEWPAGILYDNNGATLEQCDEISAEVEKVLRLDQEQKYTAFISQYTPKLKQYRTKLVNR